jgi:hypothetical protein
MSFGNQVEPYPRAQINRPLRVCHEYMHAVFRVFLVFTLCLEHESLEYVIIARDNAFSLMISQEKRN